jgi:FMN phosphatase YigB (HAD superfamily)
MDERLEGIVNGLGIGQFFEVIVQSYKFGMSKPDEALYFKAMTAAREITLAAGGWFETCPWEAGTDFQFLGMGVHVGDNPEKDAFGNAIPVILDREDKLETRQFHKIRSLKDLPGLIMPRKPPPRRNKE